MSIVIKEANALYTGGSIYTGENIWLFYGKLEDGNYFLAEDHVAWVLDTNPSDGFEEIQFEKWKEDHMVRTLEEAERLDFCEKMLDWILAHPEHGGGITKKDVEIRKEQFEEDMFN